MSIHTEIKYSTKDWNIW